MVFVAEAQTYVILSVPCLARLKRQSQQTHQRYFQLKHGIVSMCIHKIWSPGLELMHVYTAYPYFTYAQTCNTRCKHAPKNIYATNIRATQNVDETSVSIYLSLYVLQCLSGHGLALLLDFIHNTDVHIYTNTYIFALFQIRVGHELATVDGIHVPGMSLSQVQELVNGEPYTQVWPASIHTFLYKGILIHRHACIWV